MQKNLLNEFSEVFAEETSSVGMIHEDKKIERSVCGFDTGFGVRVIKNNATSYGHTNSYDKVKDIAVSLGAKILSIPDLNHEEKELVSDEDAEAIKVSAGLAWEKSPHIKQVQVIFRRVIRNIKVINSEERSAKDKREDTTFAVHVTAENNGITQTAIEVVDKLDPQIAWAAAERAVMMLSASSAPKGEMCVVISSEAGGTLVHEAVGHGLEADLVQKGLSVYKGSLAQKVASPLVTVVDDATIFGKRGTFSCDDEGTPSHRTVLIENGILQTYMHDLLTASHAGFNSTGNGRRESYRHRPIVRMTNTCLMPGNSDPRDIISSVAKGLFVKKIGGGQVNTLNGDFVFEAQEAYLIENGKIGEPVRGATLIGNGPKVLKDIDMIGTDLGFGLGTCGKDGQGVPVGHAMPTIRIPALTVGGTM